jgi:hypothetical protein
MIWFLIICSLLIYILAREWAEGRHIFDQMSNVTIM